MKDKEINSLDQTTWRCKYYIVFAPMYRWMDIFRQKQADIGKDTASIVPTKMCRDNRGLYLSGSCVYAIKHSTQV